MRPVSEPPAARLQSDDAAQRLLAQALDDDKPVRLQVQGRCMEPLIQGGDWVEVRPDAPLRLGGVVLAQVGTGELVCHRILARKGETLRLAGDRSLTAEELPRDRLLGVVRRVERGDASWRLDGWWTRGPNRLLAALHRLSLRRRGLPTGRVLEALRKALLAASSASKAGTSRRRRPASSR